MDEFIQRELNPPQQEAVRHTDGPLLILAGAGSGKTRVITYRIAYLMHMHGVLPQNILAVTFTNKAAAEMRERIEGLLKSAAAQLWMSTFHAACVRILRREADAARLSPHFVIYDSSDQLTLLRQCMKELRIDSDLYAPQSVLRRISTLKNDLMDPDTFIQEAGDFGLDEIVSHVYPLYQRRLQDNAALDFDDLLMRTVQLMRRHPDVLERYQHRFRYIMVDEYQDTNMAQYHLLNLLAERYRNLCVVGDDDQSVYRFRGANVRNILNFERDYPDATVVKLEQNYRSTGTILEAAGAVISKNARRKEKTLWTENERGIPIGYFCAQDEVHEAEVICENIVGLHREEGVAYRDCAIFYRTNAQSRVLEDGLRRAQLPYQVIGGLRFYDRKEIKDVLCYLRLLVNPQDTVSLQRIINVPRRGIGQTSMAKLEALALERELYGLDILPAALETGVVGKNILAKLRGFHELMTSLREEAPQMGVADITREVLVRSGYVDALEAEQTAEAQARLENLSELVTAAAEFDRHGEGESLQDFLTQTALLSDQDNLSDESGSVVLMTLHSSKGLEFPVVFIAGMENGLFPRSRSFDEPAEMEEERRLCYVGITRAEKRLFLTGAARRRIYGVEQAHPPSLFLSDIPTSCVQDFSVGAVLETARQPWLAEGASTGATSGAASGRGQRTRAANGAGTPAKTSATTPYGVGTQVHHEHFGRGVVQKREGNGDQLKLTVVFRDHGIKKVLVKFAPMQPV
ncbi:DNA helicase PcrA [Candidatus Entotheonella serta]|nr:DNA helicase PcrA [Candidatus Entotheonella serta]